MPNRVTPLDLAQADESESNADSILFSLLSLIFPPPLISILAKISNFLWNIFTNNQSSNDPSSWLSTLLPPLLSLFMLYLSLLAAYRTMRSTLRLFIFTIKWGVILGSLIAIYAVYTGNDQALDSMGQIPVSRGGLVRTAGKALRWAGAGSLMPPLLASALPFLNQQQAPVRSSTSSSRSTRSKTARRNSRGRSRNQNHIDDDEDDESYQETLDSEPVLSGLESLVKRLFNKGEEEDEEEYYERTGLRRNSIRSSSSRNTRSGGKTNSRNRNRNRNRNSNSGNGIGINQAINDLTGLGLDLDLENLNVDEILKEATGLLDATGNREGGRTGLRRRNADTGGLVKGLLGSFFGR